MEQLNKAGQSSVFRNEHVELGEREERPELAAVQALRKPESMPFTIRIVSADHDLQKAVQLRRVAYGRHLPAFAEKMTVEGCDRDPAANAR